MSYLMNSRTSRQLEQYSINLLSEPGRDADLDGLVGWTCELKNHARLDLSGWLNEAEAERKNGRQPFACVIAKRRGQNVAASYVVMPLSTFAALLADDVVTP